LFYPRSLGLNVDDVKQLTQPADKVHSSKENSAEKDIYFVSPKKSSSEEIPHLDSFNETSNGRLSAENSLEANKSVIFP
ncbi:hypothetical protein OESDEN_05342, partial [Oesophagostomum dentatum]